MEATQLPPLNDVNFIPLFQPGILEKVSKLAFIHKFKDIDSDDLFSASKTIELDTHISNLLSIQSKHI
jgi:hypothetical protein